MARKSADEKNTCTLKCDASCGTVYDQRLAFEFRNDNLGTQALI